MFDWVLNTPLNTIKNFFWYFQIKVNDFFNFFSTISFSYQYLPEAKVYLERSQKFYNGAWEILRNIFFFAEFTRKHLCWSFILIKLQVSILQLHWKKGLQHRCFLMNFARYLRHSFYRRPPGDYFCSTEEIFYQQISKEPLRKGEKMETAGKENNDTRKTKT